MIEFENVFASYIGREYCVAFPHARTALYYLLKELKLSPGSEILMPCITTKWILDVVVSLGLKPVYLDYDLDTYSFDVLKLKNSEIKSIKAILVTPIFGIVPNMPKIKQFCEENNILLIEDFSQCLNGEINGKKIGTFGIASIYSASSIKTLDTLGGGILVTDNKKLYESLNKESDQMPNPKRFLVFKRALINFARNLATYPFVFNLITINIMRVISFSNQESALRQTGTRNKRRLNKLPKDWFVSYSSIQAKIGLETIKSVKKNDEQRISTAKILIQIIGKENFAKGMPGGKNVYWQLPIKTNDSQICHRALRAKGIDSALTSLQLISSLENYPGSSHKKNVKTIFNNRLFIPCYAQLTKSDAEDIAGIVKSVLLDLTS